MNEKELERIALELQSINSFEAIEDIRIKYLSKKGVIAQEFQKLGQSTPEKRKDLGQQLNDFKDALTQLIKDKQTSLKEWEMANKLRSETIDITMPCREHEIGTIHPLSKALDEMVRIFVSMGFSLEQGPEIDDDFHNFTALNIPEHHPAREMHDTFYMKYPGGTLLRTHTSNVQIRAMTASKPPFRFITAGKVYRCDSDATHSPMFHQIEGVCIDKNIDMGHLKGCLQQLVTMFFESKNIEMRFRPSFFPFTEPSAEVDISINSCKWLEVMGCGMVHPNVLRNVGVDPNKYQGFAFGLGVDRFAMLKYDIKDLRTFFDSDIRWSKKCGFNFV